MALANRGTQAPAPAPAFEEQDDAAVASAAQAPAQARPPAVQPPAPQVELPQEAQQVQAAAPAPAPVVQRPAAAHAVSTQVNANRPIPLIRRLENGEPSLAGIQVGTFPRVTVDLSGWAINKNEKQLGSWIEFEVISWNYLTIVTPGKAQPTAEDNKHMRTSVDHVMLQDGTTSVAEYVKYLKDVCGYENAQTKKYIEIYGVLTGSEKTGPIPESEQGLHQLSLSPQSVVKWSGFLATAAWKASKSDDNVDRVKIKMGYDPKVLGSNKFAVANFNFA